MVRRAAAHKMKELVSVCTKDEFLEDLKGVYKQLSQEDTQDTIRVACVHTTLVLAKMLNAEENKTHTVPVIKDSVEDRSWRVRLTVAKSFDQLCDRLGPDIKNTHLMPSLVLLMKDHEQKVRREAVRIVEFLQCTSDQL